MSMHGEILVHGRQRGRIECRPGGGIHEAIEAMIFFRGGRGRPGGEQDGWLV